MRDREETIHHEGLPPRPNLDQLYPDEEEDPDGGISSSTIGRRRIAIAIAVALALGGISGAIYHFGRQEDLKGGKCALYQEKTNMCILFEEEMTLILKEGIARKMLYGMPIKLEDGKETIILEDGRRIKIHGRGKIEILPPRGKEENARPQESQKEPSPEAKEVQADKNTPPAQEQAATPERSPAVMPPELPSATDKEGTLYKLANAADAKEMITVPDVRITIYYDEHGLSDPVCFYQGQRFEGELEDISEIYPSSPADKMIEWRAMLVVRVAGRIFLEPIRFSTLNPDNPDFPSDTIFSAEFGGGRISARVTLKSPGVISDL